MISDSQIVLIVENDLVACLDLADLLESHGFVTFTATSAEEAVKLLNSTDSIDLMITDIDLGSPLSGFDLAKSARRMIANLPVLYVSGSSSSFDKVMENSRFLRKPYTSDSLVLSIKEILLEQKKDSSSI